MKKIISILTAAALLSAAFSAVPCAGAEENFTLLHENTFSSDSDKQNTSYSDTPSTWEGAAWSNTNAPNFLIKDGKFVFDTKTPMGTHEDGFVGDPYPYKSSTAVSYPRVNFTASGAAPLTTAQMEEDVYTFETELQFDESFVRFEYLLRFGAAGWVNNVTNDFKLFDVNTAGKLNFSDYSMQLALGVSYKISAVVDVRGDTRNRTLYVNGRKLAEKTDVTVAGSAADAEQLKYLNNAAVRLFPHSTDADNALKTYADTVITMDNFRIYKGNPYTVENPVEITGEDTFLKSKNGETVYTYYKALNSGAEDIFKYEIVNGTGVTVGENSGKITVDTAECGSSFTIKASLVSDPEQWQTKTVAVKDAVSFDFASGSTGWSGGTLKTDGNGNQYLYADGSTTAREDSINAALSGVGAFTLRYKMMMLDSNTSFNIGDASRPKTDGTTDTGVWWMMMYLYPTAGSDTGEIKINNYGSSYISLGTYPKNEFLPVEMRFNLEKGSYDIYIKGILVGKDIAFSQNSDITDFKLKRLIVKTPIDDVEIFSGAEVETSWIESQYPNGLIPGEDNVVCTNRFTLQGSTGDVTWSLPYGADGVSINSSTGVLSFDSTAQPGKVEVVASSGGKTVGRSEFELVKLGYFGTGEEGSAVSGFTGGIAAVENGETIIKKNAAASEAIRYSIPQNVAAGRLVVTGKLRKCTDSDGSLGYKGGLGVAIFNQNDWAAQSYAGILDQWLDFRTVIDTERKTATTLIEGKPYGAVERTLEKLDTNTDPDNISLKQIIISCDLKSLSIYRAVENLAPEAYNVKVNPVTIGTPVQASYDYFSESGLAEECTEIEWFISDKYYGNYTSVGSTYTPTEAERSKFIKVSVTPAAGELKGETVTSAPAAFNDGFVKEATYAGDTARVTAAAVNRLDKELNALLVIAEYSGGRLSRLNAEPVTVPVGEGAEVTCELSGIAGGEVKALLIDTASVRPLMAVYELSKSNEG